MFSAAEAAAEGGRGRKEGHMRATTRERGRKGEGRKKIYRRITAHSLNPRNSLLARSKNMASFAAVIGVFVHEWRGSENKQLGKMLRRRFAL